MGSAALAERRSVDRKLLADLDASGSGSRPPKEAGDPSAGALTVQEPSAESDDFVFIEEGYRAAFLGAGLDVDRTEPEGIGAWIASRSPPAELIAYLDNWALFRGRFTLGPGRRAWAHLQAAARAADHDPWRDKFRTALDDERASRSSR